MQESLSQMRAIDDRIIYKLNTSIPTQSFSGQVSAATQCKQLYDEVMSITVVEMPYHLPSAVMTAFCPSQASPNTMYPYLQ